MNAQVNSLSLKDYRSFAEAGFDFDPQQTTFVGKNGSGKTNILEAISLLSTGRGFHSHSLSECVRLGQEVAHIDVYATIEDEPNKLTAAIVTRGSNLSRSSVRYSRNGVARRRGDVMGLLKSVVFRPEDLEIVTGSPSLKRDYLDDVLVQVSRGYAAALKEYERALKHRNKLILMLREGQVSRGDFFFWDQLLVKHGDLMTRERARLVHFINTYVAFPVKGEVVYDNSVMSEERLHQYAQAEVAAGKTLVGPHRDNLIVKMQLDSSDQYGEVANFGSRGQQRLAVLWLKLAQLQFLETETKITPILLLDDIFSELDEANREIVFSLFPGHQVIMTSAEEVEALPAEVKRGKLVSM